MIGSLIRKILGLPTKEDKLRTKGIKHIESLQLKSNMIITVPQLTTIMETEVTPRLSANIHDLEAVGMLEEIIDRFEEMRKTEPNVSKILEPLYDIRFYAHEQNGIDW